MTGQEKITVLKGDNGTIITDDRYPGIHVLLWIGSPSLEQVDAYFDHRFKVIKATPSNVVCVHDLSKLQTPPATIRKQLGERGAKDDAQLSNLVCYYVVIPNALVRGVITAITWVGGSNLKPISYISDMPEAFRKALSTLDEHGAKRPALDPDNYTPPLVD